MRTADANVRTPPQATKNQLRNDMRGVGSLPARPTRWTVVASLWLRTGAVLGLSSPAPWSWVMIAAASSGGADSTGAVHVAAMISGAGVSLEKCAARSRGVGRVL